MEEGSIGNILQISIVVLCLVIVIMLYFERTTTSNIRQAVDDFKCPTCPSCPDCPACECNEDGCPDCVCPEHGGCPTCPKCPDVNTSCPSQSTVTADDIVNAIFPGRNRGVTSYGEYFPLDGLGESNVEPAYSPVINMMPNYVGGDGVPASISFQDQTLLNNNSSVGLAAQKDPPISSSQGVMSQRSSSGSTGPTTQASPAQAQASPAQASPAQASPAQVSPAQASPAQAQSSMTSSFTNLLGS